MQLSASQSLAGVPFIDHNADTGPEMVWLTHGLLPFIRSQNNKKADLTSLARDKLQCCAKQTNYNQL